MSLKSPGVILALAAAMVALVVVPGSMSAGQDEGAAFDIAAAYVSENAADLGVKSADVADVFAMSQYTSPHNGITHVNLNQRYRGLEVFGGHATVNVSESGQVIFAAGSFVADLAAGAAGQADLDALEAVEAAAEELDLDEPSDLEVVSSGGGETVVSDGGISDAPIPAKLGWQPTADGLRLAWQLVIDSSSDASLWSAAVDAESGELLSAEDWTSEDSYEDLEATLKGATSSGALQSLMTQGAAAQDTGRPWPTNPVDEGSSYRIFALPYEGPNDADRELVQNPADGDASPFGWHDTDGVLGAEFTILRGNNVHAYLDQDNNNQPDFGEPDGGPSLTFDYPVDYDEHSQDYREAVVTNLFFGCNVVHDVMWRYGFTEPTGNFQQNNYGRGGVGTDYVRCEAADGGGTNNANFSTPAADGGTPRMQMFLWPGNQLGSQNQVVVDSGPSFGAGWARFGPPAPNAGVSGQYFDAGNGCVAGDYAGNPGGSWIAIVVGGTTGCEPIQKARAADAAGASAVVMTTGTSSTGIIAPNTGGMATASPAIPAVLITAANGTTLRNSLPASGTVRKHPNHPGIRDGDFDFAIIGHEYGHGVSNRLTGGVGINCLSGDERGSEGWSDFIGLVLPLTPELDDPQQPRGLVPYVLFQPDRHGNGLRPRPYTRDMTIQPFTYDSIKTNGWLINAAGTAGTSLAIPHGVGHGWNSILWDMTWDLIDRHGFYGNIYEGWDKGGNTRSIQYVIDGLKLQGCGPGFLVARNAIIEAANTLGGGAPGATAGDACLIWSSFARRGAGFSAVQGTTARDDNTEAFDTHPNCREDFSSPALEPYGQLNQADPGKTLTLKVDLGGNQGEDVQMPQSPFSRKVDCTTLQVPSIGPIALTPREYPVPAATSGQGFKYKHNEGVYQFPWLTSEDWLGTCREFVMTMRDGTQFRAFFQFLYPFEGFSGTVKGPLTDVSSKNVFTLWWKLGGDRGLDIFASEPQSRPVDCTTFVPTGPYEPTATTTGLGYQASTARYFYPWVPDPSWLGTCREFTISLNDGTSHSTFVRYVK